MKKVLNIFLLIACVSFLLSCNRNLTDEEKEDTWRKINVSASPNRQKLYLDDLRGESGLYKILGEGKSAIRTRLVDEVSKYKDIPEDDNKNYIKAESLAKPDIGGGKPARAANKKKSGNR